MDEAGLQRGGREHRAQCLLHPLKSVGNIEVSGMAELEDAALRKALNELMAAHASKKTVQPAPTDEQKTAP